ncbi:hypothetical protein LNP74_00660 [Klebsiella pneumoniae subsp. pneumoniae]|nr:hypothetical protein [Klebsiella pneumoniae subsp. pneumoniae]
MMRLEKMLRDSGDSPRYEGDIRPPERYLMERFITARVWVGRRNARLAAGQRAHEAEP